MEIFSVPGHVVRTILTTLDKNEYKYLFICACDINVIRFNDYCKFCKIDFIATLKDGCVKFSTDGHSFGIILVNSFEMKMCQNMLRHYDNSSSLNKKIESESLWS